MSNPDPETIPESSRAEWALTIAKAGAQFIPVVGGAAAELLGAIVTPQLEKRRTAWFENIANGLFELQKQVADLTPEKLAQNEGWETAFLTASQGALRTHQKEKLEALRNAVLNVAAGAAPNDDLQLVLFNLTEALTSGHIRLLKLFISAEQYSIPCGVSQLYYPAPDIWQVIQREVPELDGQREWYHFYVSDLVSRGLLTRANTSPVVPPHDPHESTSQHPTGLAYRLISFITSPLTEPGA